VLQVRPLEEQFKFGSFFTPLLHESDFEAKPSVLLLGQYSTGVGGSQLPVGRLPRTASVMASNQCTMRAGSRQVC
jgi:hypothetical protein